MNFLSMRRAALALGFFSALTLGAAEEPLDLTRASLEKWVETRQLVSRTRADWQADKELLEQSALLYERELKALEDSMAKVGGSNAQAEKEKAESESALKASNETLETARSFAADFEGKLAKLVPQLPEPLREILKPHLNRLPAPGAATKMAATERLQALVGVLNEIDKFNNAISIFNEKRKNPKQEEVAVQTVYVGLGAAYFVNDAGDFAGVGAPAASGWEWSTKPDLAPRVREIIRIYRSEEPARFVSLPAVVK